MTQYHDVRAVLEEAAGKPMYLHEIAKAIKKKFRRVHAETAISARIREIRHDLESEGTKKTIYGEPPPKKRAHRYWIARA